MCYPKPGPRCSASAAARYARAKHAAFAYFEAHRGEVDFDEFEVLSKARDDAAREYDITPAGIKALARSLADHPDSLLAQQKLDNARAERAARLAAVKSKDAGDPLHQADLPAHPTYTRTELTTAGTTLTALGQYDPDVATLLDESEAWATKLTADEIEVLHWYSMGGYAQINGGLSNADYEQSHLARGMGKTAANAATVALLDSALAKTDADKTAIVYRRHFFYNENGSFGHLTEQEMRAQFAPGSIYKPGFFMSSSLDPANVSMGARDGGFMACLEIKTNRGAALPAVANMGTAETEVLLPRDGAYRVVNNNCQVNINHRGQSKNVWLIQLEELPRSV